MGGGETRLLPSLAMRSLRPPLAQTEGRFTSFDGTPIEYQLLGSEDGVPLLLGNGLGARVPAYRFIIERYAPAFRFVCWDYRGLYGSGRPLGGYGDLSVAAHAADGLALLDHLEIDRFHAVGWSMGVQVVLEMQRTAADRFLSMVLHNGVAGRPYRSLMGTHVFERHMPGLLRRLQLADGALTRVMHYAIENPALIPILVRLGFAHHDLDRGVFLELARGFHQLDLHLYLELLVALGEHDASDVLADVICPTLVLASSKDLLTPLEAAREVADAIEHADLEVLPGGSHYAAVEMPELVNEHLDRFYAGVGVDRLPH